MKQVSDGPRRRRPAFAMVDMPRMSNLSESVLLPVAVISGADQQALFGRLVSADRSSAVVELLHPAPPALEAGLGIIVRPENERRLEIVGVIDRVNGTRIEVEVSRAGHREERWSPRERCRLRFRVREVTPAFDQAAWVSGDVSPPGPWLEPDPRVEISLTGLAFLSDVPLSGTVLITFVHPENEQAHRVVGSVVRTQPTRRVGISRVSVQFVHVPEPSGAALADILLALQDAALEAFGAGTTLDLPPVGPDMAKPPE